VSKAKKLGRPSSYTPEIGEKICARLIDGESLRAICRDEDMPDRQTVTNWLIKDETFFGQYTRAREAQADCLVDEILEISDDGRNDWMERRSEAEKGAGVESGWVLNGEHVQRSRLRVDTRKWFASKVFPKRYGDKVEHSGPEGGPIVVSWAANAAGGTSDPSGK
jgi:hypothetical protein